MAYQPALFGDDELFIWDRVTSSLFIIFNLIGIQVWLLIPSWIFVHIIINCLYFYNFLQRRSSGAHCTKLPEVSHGSIAGSEEIDRPSDGKDVDAIVKERLRAAEIYEFEIKDRIEVQEKLLEKVENKVEVEKKRLNEVKQIIEEEKKQLNEVKKIIEEEKKQWEEERNKVMEQNDQVLVDRIRVLEEEKELSDQRNQEMIMKLQQENHSLYVSYCTISNYSNMFYHLLMEGKGVIMPQSSSSENNEEVRSNKVENPNYMSKDKAEKKLLEEEKEEVVKKFSILSKKYRKLKEEKKMWNGEKENLLFMLSNQASVVEAYKDMLDKEECLLKMLRCDRNCQVSNR